MATKATKTVKVRVAVVYSNTGDYQAGGYRNKSARCLSDGQMVGDAHSSSWTDKDELPHACIVDIELPIPKPLVGKVLNVKAVKP
jgi:hypothetical protein